MFLFHISMCPNFPQIKHKRNSFRKKIASILSCQNKPPGCQEVMGTSRTQKCWIHISPLIISVCAQWSVFDKWSEMIIQGHKASSKVTVANFAAFVKLAPTGFFTNSLSTADFSSISLFYQRGMDGSFLKSNMTLQKSAKFLNSTLHTALTHYSKRAQSLL